MRSISIAIIIAIIILIIIIIIALLCLFFGICPSPEPSSLGDYGDAPDGTMTGYPEKFDFIDTGFAQIGNFPTLFKNDGAHTLNVDEVFLGENQGTKEWDADDLNDPDGWPNLSVSGDSDDGLTTIRNCLGGGALFGHSNMPGTFYLNLLVDLNHDGFWGGEFHGSPEWVIPNEEIIIDSTTPRFEHCIPEHAYLSQTWMRAAITTTSITSSDWDGTGEFNSGEIEDHILLPIDGVLSYNATTLSAPTGQVAPPVVNPTDDVDIAGVDGVPGSFDVTGNLSGPQGTFVATCPTVSSSGPSHMYPVSTTCSVTATIVEPGQYCWDITITETTGNYDPSMVALLDDIPDECFTVVEITIIPCTFHDCDNGVLRP